MWSAASLVVLLGATTCYAFTWDEETDLDRYVKDESDRHLHTWSVINKYRFDNESCWVYILNMTSHQYVDETFSDRPIWWHFMGISIPDNPRRNFAYMFIDGGANGWNESPPGPDDGRVRIAREVAGATGYFGAFLLQVPNKYVTFTNDPDQIGRGEDRYIAWTWKTYIDKLDPHYRDPRIIARMPMTKAGTRGLDTINQFLLQETGRNVTQFAVGGGSKRGWTAWSVAATDKRVIAVTPMVMSLLNFNDTLQSHFRNLGGWTFVFNDYWELNLTKHFHDEDMLSWEFGLYNHEDMFRYKERLELIPKLLISACGDEFFLVTDHGNWWDQMGGPKWLMMNQNAEHSLAPWYVKIGETVASWMLLLLEDSLPNIPSMVWLRGETLTGARILLSTDTTPDTIQAWTAHTWRNDTRKDFRLVVGYPPFVHPVLWTSIEVDQVGPNLYEVDIDRTDIGFGAVFIDLIWTRLTGLRLHLTTDVQITPDVYPFPSCYGEECYGELT